MDKPLIVGVDGSDPSLRALDWAVDRAEAYGVPLRVVHSSRWEWYEGHTPSFDINRSSVQVLSEHIVASAVERAQSRAGAMKVTGEVLPEDPSFALVRVGAEAGAVVVGSRGRGELADLLLGSVSLSVAARATVPVLVVRGEAKNVASGFRTVVLGVDDARDSALAVEFAFQEALTAHASLTVLHAWRCPAREVPDVPMADHEEHRDRAEEQVELAVREAMAAHPEVTVRREAIEGHARTVLLDAARGADLLVVGARRRKGHVGMQLGPVNHAVLHHAVCPVAVVPHG
ncbi:universal stress protein [Streptomyces sp. KL118A]|uniref:universal stress protein n=1 Tax=Streptomyces sp. KL118A TaxID=3045153 RepID=UPI00278BB966|nr:universal stress protein [Streptomyces sp. KL118A]